MPEFFSQSNPRWNYLQRYDESSSDSLEELDKAILKVIDNTTRNDSTKNVAYKVLFQFAKSVSDLIENGMNEKCGTDDNSAHGYSIHEFGCWDCTMSMIISHFKERVYEYGKSESESLPINPKNFIKSLRSWQLLSPIGYSFDIINDPIAIITKRKVQLVLHEDYGVRGRIVKNATVFQHALKLNKLVGIAVCVQGHPFLGKGYDPHWVFIDPESTPDKVDIYDPSSEHDQKAAITINQKDYMNKDGNVKIYEVCVYSTPENINEVLEC